jgi:hypothetical protein
LLRNTPSGPNTSTSARSRCIASNAAPISSARATGITCSFSPSWRAAASFCAT